MRPVERRIPAGPMNGEYLATRLFLVITLPVLSSFSSLGNDSPWDRYMSFCSAISISDGSVISNTLDWKCLWDGSNLNKNATVCLYFTIELNLSHFPKGKFFSVKTSTTKFDEVSRQMSISHDGLLSLILSITLVSGLNGQSVVLSILGPLTQLLSLRASEEIPRVPVSAGLSPLSM